MRRLPVVFVLIFAACASSKGSGTGLGTVANTPPTLSPPHFAASLVPSASPTVAKVKVPKLVGLSLAKARRLLQSLGFGVTIRRKISTTLSPGTVIAQSR